MVGRGAALFDCWQLTHRQFHPSCEPTNPTERPPSAPVDLQFLMRGLRTADNFIKLAEATILATFNGVQSEEFPNHIFTDAHQNSPKDVKENYQEIAFQNFRQCFFL